MSLAIMPTREVPAVSARLVAISLLLSCRALLVFFFLAAFSALSADPAWRP